MKTYQLCYSEFNVLKGKLKQAENGKAKSENSNSSRKQKSLQKSLDKKTEKYESARIKCNRSRNEYLLCIDAANAALYKFFADDLNDLIDCMDLSMDYWINLILTNVIAARKAVCQKEMNSLAMLSGYKESVQVRADKQRFFESNSSTFMLPKRFELKCDTNETITMISLENGLMTELRQREEQIKKRLNTLRTESDNVWRTMEETEQQMKNILSAATIVEITEQGIADHRPPSETLETELSQLSDDYLENFRHYLLNSNLIMRLEARSNGIGNARINQDLQNCSLVQYQPTQKAIGAEVVEWHERSRRKKRIGSATEPDQISAPKKRPRLFGGNLEEYVEATGESIPIIVQSCVRVISRFPTIQGLFRVSGSQVEINNMKEAFENGEDPLHDVIDSSDINSVAGLLKLFLRELRLIPVYLFEQITECAKCQSTTDFVNQIIPLLNKLPHATYLLLRYLFAFLSHLSEFSDENMMDPYNLAICFGPTLLPIPEGKDQVYYQNYVNEVVKNLIVHHDIIFSTTVPGPVYDKYSETILYADDGDDYFGGALQQRQYGSEKNAHGVWEPMVWSTHSGIKEGAVNSSNTATMTSTISSPRTVDLRDSTRQQHRQSLLVSSDPDPTAAPNENPRMSRDVHRRRSIDEELFEHNEKRSNGRHELHGQKSFDVAPIAAHLEAQSIQPFAQKSPSSAISSTSNQSKGSNQQRIRIPVAPNTTITSYNSNIPSPNQQSIRSWKSSVSSIEVPQQDNKNSPEWATTQAHTSIQKPVSMQVSMATITLSGASSDKVVASPILAPHSASSVQQPDLAGMLFRNVRRLWLIALRLHPQTSAQFQCKYYSVGDAFPSPPDPISCCDAVGKYAKRLAAEHPDIDPDCMTEKSIDLIRQEIEKNIDDPVLKTYVLMEVKARLRHP
uniref:Rho-GAP domain-containing protein n=1 Tax=Acrobeloides nanus TaxID=290746 RepID=A0A914CR30_9BILA